ncbi:TIR domain-containing protein [Streptomyces sp. NPDC047072]|uniref:TIR domain-containing protein n=1 Tax=Streptomyces sp. NPDC047072 TaxID=3154809 RepID=UPI0033DE1DD5
MSVVPSPVRVFISYAHDDPAHVERVRDFWLFLRECGIDAELDLPADERRQDWALWMSRGIRGSRYVIVVASAEYKRRAEGDAPAGVGSGVQWEAGLLRRLVYEDPTAALDRIAPVVLPGGSAADLPDWLGGRTTTYYPVGEFTVAGAEKLLRLLTGQRYETVPALGSPVILPSRAPTPSSGPVGTPAPPSSAPAPSAAFRFPDPKALLDALLACEKLHRLDTRHELLALMGENLGHVFVGVDESRDARTHLRALVRRSASSLTPDAVLRALYDALADIAPDDTGTERVRELLVAAGLDLGEE